MNTWKTKSLLSRHGEKVTPGHLFWKTRRHSFSDIKIEGILFFISLYSVSSKRAERYATGISPHLYQSHTGTSCDWSVAKAQRSLRPCAALFSKVLSRQVEVKSHVPAVQKSLVLLIKIEFGDFCVQPQSSFIALKVVAWQDKSKSGSTYSSFFHSDTIQHSLHCSELLSNKSLLGTLVIGLKSTVTKEDRVL